MAGFAHANINRATGLVRITGVGANGHPINVLLPRMAALDLSAQLELAALQRVFAPFVDDRSAFDHTLDLDPVERT